MRHSIKVGIVASVWLWGLLSGSATAVEVLEAESSFRHAVVEHGSHGTCVDISWSHEVDEGILFDLQATSSEESCEWSIWVGHCDANGFLFSGDLLPNPEAWPYGWGLHLQSQISVLLDVTTPTQISASRIVEGVFPAAQHTVIIIFPDGSNEVLLGSEDSINSSEEILSPGIYRVTFSIDSYEFPVSPFDYTGLVEVNWDSPVGVNLQSWGSVKSLFRAGD